MTNVENLKQLHAEIDRLKSVAKIQEEQIKSDLKEIREDFRPENIFLKTLSALTGIRMNKNEFFKNGIAYGLSLIVQRFILKTERKMENRAYDFVDSIFDRIKNFIHQFTNADAKRSERKESGEDFIPEE